MRNSLSFLLLLLVAVSQNLSLSAQTVMFTDNFDRSTFVTNTAYGSPATTYKFTIGGTSTINTTLVSGSNYRANINSGSTANRSLFFAPLAPFSAPNTLFSRVLSGNYGLVTWTFNMRTSTAVTTTSPLSGAMAGGIDLCGNAAGNIYNGAPKGYGVVFNSGATGGVDLVRFSAGMATNTVLITQTTTMPKTDYYSVRVTYDPATNHWSLYVRDDGAAGFADPSSGVTLQQGSTITDATYTSQVNVNFGALYTWTAGVGKTMSIDNFKLTVNIPPCGTPGLPSGVFYTNTATSTSASFSPPGVAPSGYILVASSGPLSGLPTAGQSVTVGTAVGANGTIIGSGAGSPVVSSSPLSANTAYTLTLFPYNNTGCTGGPVFNTAAPANNIVTCPNPPVLTSAGTPTATTIPAVTWTAPDPGGDIYSTYTYLLNVYTDPALTIPATGYPSGGTTVTSPVDITGLTSGVTYWYTVTAVDSACNSAPSASNNGTTSVVPCSGTPTAGASASNVPSVTGSNPFTLNLIGASGETGISFQWQSSACGSTWTNIGSSQTSAPYTAAESAGTYYQCVLTCSNSGLSNHSTVLYVPQTTNTYCNPTSVNGCSAGDGVNAFTLTGACGSSISDPGPMICGSLNTDHTSYNPVKLFPGGTYSATVNSNFDGDDVYIWIDFDNSGTFEATEMVYSTNTGAVPSLPYFYSFSMTIPAGATYGMHRMRVIVDNTQTLTTGCDALTFGTSVDYLVQIVPNLSLSYNAPVCIPGSLVLTANPSMVCGGTYSWAGPSAYSNVTVNANTVTPPLVSGIYSVTATVNGVNSCGSAATSSVLIYTAPSITGISGMCVGSTATLTGSPSGGNWTSSNASTASVGSATGLVTGVALGSALISYTLPSSGCASTQSVAVTPIPGLHTVTGGGNYCSGTAGVHVGLDGSGASVSYQLYNSGVAVGSPITGTGSSLDFGLMTSPGNYTVTANPGTSCSTNMTGTAVVFVNPLPVEYNLTGGGNFCVGGTGVDVGLDGSDPAISYQLLLNGFNTGAPLAGTGSALDFGPQTGLGIYNIIATNPATTCYGVMAGNAAVGNYPVPNLYAITGGGAYCIGGTGADIGLNNSDTGFTYQLISGGLGFGASVTGVGGAIDFGAVATPGTYSVNATGNTTGCVTSMIGNVVVSVLAAPSVFNVTGGGSYCSGGTGVNIGLDGSMTGTNYNLFSSGMLLSSATGTGSAIDFGAQTTGGSYTVVATLVASGCSAGMNGSASVAIKPLPFAYNMNGGGGYCVGSAAPDVSLSGSDVGNTYQLFNGANPVGSSIPGSGGVLDFGTQAAPGSYTVMSTTGAGCSGNMSGSAVVAVNPLPAGYLVSGGGSYCAGAAGVDIQLAGSDSGISYQLKLGPIDVGSALAGSGSVLDFGLIPGNGTYSVRATDT